jgi:RNA polymerase primary sigma factor
MGVADSLVDKGDSVTYDELLALVPEPEESVEFLDEVIEYLAIKGVSIQTDVESPEVEQVVVNREPVLNEALQSGNLLDIYLTDMGQEPLLTHEEEVALARKITLGHAAQRALNETDYTAEEYARLFVLVEAGQAARERLSSANTRLVISIAKKYRGYGIPFTDLIQDGNVGLMRAVDRYDPESGNRFSTYATWWIRQAVTRSLANNGRVIRIPVHVGTRMREMARVGQRLEMAYGRRPSTSEIAEEMDESPRKIRQMMDWASQPLSLEQPYGDEGEAELGEMLEDDQVRDPGDLADDNIMSETLTYLLNSLTEREVRVLRLRYGLRDGQVHTLQQVADKFGLSRERIRQIEREALVKLRLAGSQSGLEQFLASN